MTAQSYDECRDKSTFLTDCHHISTRAYTCDSISTNFDSRIESFVSEIIGDGLNRIVTVIEASSFGSYEDNRICWTHSSMKPTSIDFQQHRLNVEPKTNLVLIVKQQSRHDCADQQSYSEFPFDDHGR
jgi:hypothetical protein